MAGKDNLKPFKKGEDPRRNLKGAPKQLPELKALIYDTVGEEGFKAIIDKLKQQAATGCTKSAQILLERGYGKSVQPIDMKTEISGSINYTREVIKTNWKPDEPA